MTALEDDPEKAISIAQENWKKAKESGLYKILNVNELRAEGYLPLGY
jgi:hypothetical protein